MLPSVYAEDIFLQFYGLVQSGQLNVQQQDFGPILSFHSKIIEKSQLTQNQANYILKLLEKYKNLSLANGLDYTVALPSLQWKQPFRVLDLSKKIYVEKTDTGNLEICLKFPYQLKKEFEEEININLPHSDRVSFWDHNDKVRRLNFYEFNLITLYEFAVKHGFDIDDSFMLALAEVEEIWQNSDSILPYSEISYLGVELKNADEDTVNWWNSKSSTSFENDLLLAKSMGFPLRKNPENLIEKIANSQHNTFWLKTNEEFFSLIKYLEGKICILLDRSSNILPWLQNFVADADKNGVSRDEVKVCFRDSKDTDTGLNEWIKLAGVGGKVETGKILIFETKPAKWLFKNSEDVKIIVTNNLYPATNQLTKDWLNSHPCVIYLGDIKPSNQRGKDIVEL